MRIEGNFQKLARLKESESERLRDHALDRAIDATLKYLLAKFQRTTASASTVASSKNGHGLDCGYWLGELEADTTLESDYILFLYFLDPEGHREKIRKLANYVRKHQLADGSWNIYYGGPSDVSASVKAYFALKLAGHSTEEPFMVKAREAILAMGGAEKVNCFTKIYLSFLNQFDWKEIPAIPPEIVLLPRFFYFNIYEMSYWSRAILIPLSILYAKKPNRQVSSKVNIREIFAAHAKNGNGNGNGVGHRKPAPTTQRKLTQFHAPQTGSLQGERQNGHAPADPNLLSWRNFFLLMDRLLKLVEKAPIKPLRNLALKKAEEWMLTRSEASDGLGAIFPAMVNSVLAMRCLGYDESHPCVANTLDKLRELEIEEGDALRLQPCLSPVWDTALAVNAMREANYPQDAPEIVAAGRWLVSKEVRKSGDWQVRAPGVEASGWYFQFQNEFYPDIDDSAAVLLALDRVDHTKVEGLEAAIGRGVNWILSLQCSNGGWAAFDVDVKREALTQVPYADHNAMLDPACADITGRVLEMLSRFPALRRNPEIELAIQKGLSFLKSEQEDDGSWYGRWGVNYIYGTWQALKGVLAVGEDPQAPYVRRAVHWLKSHQNPNGGWGESCDSYKYPEKKGRGTSTASQTSWAIMGLVAAGEVESEAVERGVSFLLRTQKQDGSWDEAHFTGTGFPEVFYLNYHLYRTYFPLFALGYYRNVKKGVPPVRGQANVVLPEGRGRSTFLQGRGKRRGLFGMMR
jgi:squalene-hopene/tetraprenyl-beta-curcumene cyclase